MTKSRCSKDLVSKLSSFVFAGMTYISFRGKESFPICIVCEISFCPRRNTFRRELLFNPGDGIVVVVVVVANFTMGWLKNALSWCFACAWWLVRYAVNLGANFTHADQPDQPNLYFWEQISRGVNLSNFCSIWFKFVTEVIGRPLFTCQMFELSAIYQPK